MSAFVIEDEALVEELLKRATQEGRSLEDFLRLVVEVWPTIDADHTILSEAELTALLHPSTEYPTLADVIEQGLAGGLEGRADIGDSVEYVQQLRHKLWERLS